MKRLLCGVVSLSMVMLLGTAARAVVPSSDESTYIPTPPVATTPVPTPVYAPYGGNDFGFYPYTRSSSVPEGYLNGVASVIQAQAMYGVAASQAAANWSLARQRNIQAATDYYQLRKANREYQLSLRPPKMTKDDLARLAQSRLPPRLSTAELDPATGRITWPAVLMEPQFASLRTEIDRGFAERGAKGYLGPASETQLTDSIQHLRHVLAQHIRDYPQPMYIPADRFLRGLAYEATLPGGVLATRTAAASY